MVIIVGILKVDPAHRDEFIANRIESMRTTRAEEGCVTYAIAADPVEPDTVVLTERWTSQATLDAHREVMRANPVPMTIPILSRDIVVYEIASSRPL